MTKFAKKTGLGLIIWSLLCFAARGETLAETVVRLSNELAALKTRVDLANAKGMRVAYLGVSNSDDGVLNLNANGGVQVEASASPDGPVLRLHNSTGKVMVELGTGSVAHGGLATFYDANGNPVAFIGTGTDGKGRLDVHGTVFDFAEVFETLDDKLVAPGTVVVSAGDEYHVRPSASAYDTKVIGVVSGAGGLSSGLVFGTNEGTPKHATVALAGQVYVRVCVEGGEIRPGDLLVSSSRSGVAMRACDPAKSVGTVVGKALGSYSSHQGEGLVRMLVMLR